MQKDANKAVTVCGLDMLLKWNSRLNFTAEKLMVDYILIANWQQQADSAQAKEDIWEDDGSKESL